MARIRTLKPEFFHSKKLARCTPHARLLFAALMQLADREGRLRWIPMQIHSHAFPYEQVDIAALCAELEAVGSVLKYVVGEDEFLNLPHFTLHQRVKSNEAESRLPAPPCGDTSSDGAGCAPTWRPLSAEVAPIGGVGRGTGNREQEQGTGNRETRGSARESVSDPGMDVWDPWRQHNPTARKRPTKKQRATIRARRKDYSAEELANYFRWVRESGHKRARYCREESHDGWESIMRPGHVDERMPWVAEWIRQGAVKARPKSAGQDYTSSAYTPPADDEGLPGFGRLVSIQIDATPEPPRTACVCGGWIPDEYRPSMGWVRYERCCEQRSTG